MRNRVYKYGHPKAAPDGRIYRYVIVAEEVLGRYLLSSEVIHHVDRNEENDSKNNLVICQDQAYHRLLHQRLRALKESGDALARQCRYCRKWDRPGVGDMRVHSANRGNSTKALHLSCAREAQRK